MAASLVSLPPEIIFEILCCLPVRDFIRLTCVSKYLSNLFTTNRKFLEYSHLHRSTQNKNRPLTPNNLVIFTRFSNDKIVREYPEDVVLRFQNMKFTNPLYLGDNYHFLGSCNGIICFANLFTDDNKKRVIYLWNPALHQIRAIHHPDVQSFDFVGFGYDAINRYYKIIRIRGDIADIYSLKSNSWKMIKYDFPPRTSRIRHCLQHFVVDFNGCLSWISTDNFYGYYMSSKVNGSASLLSFNMATDELDEYLIPDSILSNNGVFCGLGVFKGNLSFLIYYLNGDKYDIWSLNDSTWLKVHGFYHSQIPSVDILNTNRALFGAFCRFVITPGGKILYEKCILLLFDLETEHGNIFKMEEGSNANRCFIVQNYVESLISIVPVDVNVQEVGPKTNNETYSDTEIQARREVEGDIVHDGGVKRTFAKKLFRILKKLLACVSSSGHAK